MPKRVATDTTNPEKVTGPMVFFGDVCANLVALDRVLASTRAAGAEQFFAVGDLFLHGTDPAGVFKRLAEISARVVPGPADVALATVDPAKVPTRDETEREALERFRDARRALGELSLARIRGLPPRIRITLGNGARILVMFGSPYDALEPITHDQTDEQVEQLLGDERIDVLVCAGTLVPFEREARGVRIVGLGSVGRGGSDRVSHYTFIEPAGEGVDVRQGWVAWAPAD